MSAMESTETTEMASSGDPKESVDCKEEEKMDVTEMKKEDDVDTLTNQHLSKSTVESQLNRRTTFSSEHFKLELQNLPRFFSVSQTKKLFGKHNLNFHKIKPVGKSFMYVNFGNVEDRDRALAKLNNLVVKKQKLRVTIAPPPKDPMLKNNTRVNKTENSKESELSYEDQLTLAVSPLAALSYEAQLDQKMSHVRQLMQNLQSDIEATFSTPRELNDPPHNSMDNSTINLEPMSIVRSPEICGYRNKCEFSIGRHPRTQAITVGFRLASYKRGSIDVMPIQDIKTVSSKMKEVVKHFELFVESSNVPVFNSISQEGNWKQLTVRSTQSHQMLIVAVLNPQNLSQDQKNKIKEQYSQHMRELGPHITSINILFEGHRRRNDQDAEIELLHGSPTVTEKLGSLSFEVSARSFFQVNTLAALVLYEEAGKMAALDSSTVLIDVCCGTGTIGIALASKCHEVLGLELVKEAVDDARRNAEANNVGNATFIQGKAEETLSRVIDKYKGLDEKSLVAIVDPPRAGLHPKGIHSLRTSGIKRLVFISCDAKAAKNNFVSLCRPQSKAYKGEPFVITKVLPVDLFPHTRHFELLLLFER